MPIRLPRKHATAVAGFSLLLFSLYLASPQGLWAALRQTSPDTAVWISVLAIGNLIAVAARFKRVMRHCSVLLDWGTAWRACMAGNLASLAFIPLFAQVAGRQAVLHRMGVRPVVTATVSALERLLLAAVSATAAGVGAALLLGQEALLQFLESLSLIQLGAVFGVSAIIAFVYQPSRFERGLMRLTLSRSMAFAGLEILGITLVSHVLIVGAFTLAFSGLAPHLTLAQVVAGATIVSFAASLPLSVGGWGTRELAAVLVFGQLGVDAATAMAASVMVGLCSTVAILLTSATILVPRSHAEPKLAGTPFVFNRFEIEKIASWLLGMTTVALVFFQVHLMINDHTINVNLGDPFAMLALAAVVLVAASGREMPKWALQGFNLWLLCFSTALLLAFAVGLMRIGLTPWALGNKLTGWLVLMGYLSAGYLLVRDHGQRGMLRLVEVSIAVLCTIIWIKVLVRGTPWFPTQFALEPMNFEGFSGNRNAFAFQICAVLALALGYLPALVNKKGNPQGPLLAQVAALATLLSGVYFTSSRTGMVVAATLVVAAFFIHANSRRAITVSAAIALAIAMITSEQSGILSSITAFLGLDGGTGSQNIAGRISLQESDSARWAANMAAIDMWMQTPWMGAGLGSFFANSEALLGEPLIIHSTPLWLVVEFGLPGVAVVVFAGFLATRHFVRRRPLNARDQAVALLLLAFALFSLLHEMLYQRTLWLFLGALLAIPATRHSKNT